MASKGNSMRVDEAAWYTRQRRAQGGLNVADTFTEIKEFAYRVFDTLDTDLDGFLSCDELSQALDNPVLDWRERSFVCFLIRRLDEIKEAYHEEWNQSADGISRVDIQEYFKLIKQDAG